MNDPRDEQLQSQLDDYRHYVDTMTEPEVEFCDHGHPDFYHCPDCAAIANGGHDGQD